MHDRWSKPAAMFMIWGDWFAAEVRSLGSPGDLFDSSEIKANHSITRRIRATAHEAYEPRWRYDPELQRHYRAASLLLPIGSIFVLALVVLLMVLFKRCPQMVAAIVASIVGVIIIVATLISLNHTPVYS